MSSRLARIRCIPLCLALLLVLAIPLGAQLVPPDTTDGRTTLAYDNEPFANFSAGDGGAGFVKFAIVLDQPQTVYFQDSNLYLFHYDFATTRLAPFLGMSRSQFDAVSLRRSGQQVVLGAVILPPFGGPREYGIQFVGLDPYPKEMVKAWFDAVKMSVLSDSAVAPVYIPSFEQKAQASTDRAWFAEQGIEVDGIERWIHADAVYADGWAFGRLVFVPGNELAAAYAAGTLKPTDVLLTDGVPAEVPFVAGILTLTAATPNSHVAILARSQGVPFAWIARESERTRIETLLGRDVLVRASAQGEFALRVSAADRTLDAKVRSLILKLKRPGPVAIKARKRFGAISADATQLHPRDIKFFGGKAANFGLLRREIPGNSPRAIAFSFDLWEQFLGNIDPSSGLSLRAEIAQRLGGFTWPPDFAAASAALVEVRNLIRDAKFTDTQKSAIVAALTNAGFQPTRMLRFRSSSNVEDSEHLSGAGLYESFSGCIADSIDGNDEGPCGCAPDEAEEKTVLRALEKVFASFYNDNAWLERLRFGIPEGSVGMAVLVHENAPDADEMANGVATINRRPSASFGSEFEFNIVSQLGAVSVTNPEGGAKPEVVLGGQSGAQGQPFVFTQQHSDLVQLGAHVMTWETDYHALTALLVKVAQGYAQLFPEKGGFTLDVEFKKLRPGTLQVRQVREIPERTPQPVAPIVLNEPTEFVVLQTEFGDAFAFHRLKSVLTTETLNTRLRAAALDAPLRRKSTFDFVLGGARTQQNGGPFGWPGYRFTAPQAGVQNEQWKAGHGGERVTFRLRTSLPTEADATVGPVITQRDFTLRLTAIYKTPQPYLDFAEGRKTRTSDSATLIPSDRFVPDDVVQTRRIQTAGGVIIEPRFYWPNVSELGGFVIIKTLPLAAWDQTTITGLTTDPLVLTDYFAQTYAPGHHNFVEVFLFEPALDPNVNAQQRAELEAANIRLIHVFHDRFLGGDNVVQVIGFDGKFRAVP